MSFASGWSTTNQKAKSPPSAQPHHIIPFLGKTPLARSPAALRSTCSSSAALQSAPAPQSGLIASPRCGHGLAVRRDSGSTPFRASTTSPYATPTANATLPVTFAAPLPALWNPPPPSACLLPRRLAPFAHLPPSLSCWAHYHSYKRLARSPQHALPNNRGFGRGGNPTAGCAVSHHAQQQPHPLHPNARPDQARA